MKNIITIIQIIISVLLIVVIVLQSQGTGLGGAWGGTGESYRSKRGVEKILLFATIILASLFFITSVINIVL